MRNEDFIFSLYPNDLVKVTHKKALKLTKAQKDSDLPDSREVKSELLYFIGADIAVASIACRNHDNSYLARIGIVFPHQLAAFTEKRR